MDRHPGILQLRIQTATVDGNEVEPLEWIGAEADGGEKENENEGEGAGNVRHQLAVAGAIRPERDRRVDRENQCPEQQGSRLSSPERGDGVDLGQICARVR